MRLRSLMITVALFCPSVVAGQSLRTANVVAFPAGAVRNTDKDAVSHQFAPMSTPWAFGDSVVTRKARIRRGAIIGAIVGGVIGGVGGTQLNYDCPTISEPCHARAEKTQATVGLAAVGALLGAGVGAIIARVSSRP